MELNPFHRLCDWMTWVASVTGVSVGVMTLNEKIGLAGLVLGALFGWRAWVHRARMEKAQDKHFAMIERLLTLAAQRELTEPEWLRLMQLMAGNGDEGSH